VGIVSAIPEVQAVLCVSVGALLVRSRSRVKPCARRALHRLRQLRKVCAQNAKRIQDDTAPVAAMLKGPGRKVACLAPSFPAAFNGVLPRSSHQCGARWVLTRCGTSRLAPSWLRASMFAF
jgi:hypothetical protein